jgi:DNA-directed RNA polymerase subunit RPC12/RpoP
MRFQITCLECGYQVKSPEGRDPVTFTDFQLLIKEMGLVCRKCGGEVVGSEEGK